MLKLCHSAGYRQHSTGDLLGALQVYASPVLPADGLNMAPLQAVGAYGFAPSAFGGAAADTGMSLPATQQSEEMHAPPAGPTQRKLTKDRDARLLEALTMEEVRVPPGADPPRAARRAGQLQQPLFQAGDADHLGRGTAEEAHVRPRIQARQPVL
jgi:hypothetical protein